MSAALRPDLGRSLVLEAATRVPDGSGGFTQSWASLGTLWAEVTPLESGGAGPGGTRLQPVRVVIRSAPSGSLRRPAPGQRFRDGGRVLTIDAVADADPRGRFLRCLAHEEATP